MVEDEFDLSDLGRREARFAQGNGYLGFRGATEERYVEEQRLMGIAGVFNRGAGELDVAESVNVGDLLALDILLDGDRFALDRGEVLGFEQALDLYTGELARTIDWRSPSGIRCRLVFKRFASLSDQHLVAQRLELSTDRPCLAVVRSGFDAGVTNRGVQHLTEVDVKVEGTSCHLHDRTIDSQIDVVTKIGHRLTIDGVHSTAKPRGIIGRRDVAIRYETPLEADAELVLERTAVIHTSRDPHAPTGTEDVTRIAHSHFLAARSQRYDELLDSAAAAWENFWATHDVQVASEDFEDQFALRFALYHLRAMTSFDSDYVGISAKGFTGDGYKGHSFWDTEFYILPMWTLTEPDVAKRLLRYRYRLLPSARRLAAVRGYAGAMFPWESAWHTDAEVTPTRGNIDVVTGERDHIWTGQLQHHISAGIAHAFWNHVTVTGDHDVATDYGYEVLFEVARFWLSRLDPGDGGYHINNVIGPDEYKERVDDNTFTNYLAHWCLSTAAVEYTSLAGAGSEVLARIAERIRLAPSEPEEWAAAAAALVLPSPRSEDGLIPQDATYLTLPVLPELEALKQEDRPFHVLRSYSLSQLSDFQVSKQADLIILFNLFPARFDAVVMRENLEFYESRTLHDSSLSTSMYCLVAARLAAKDMAWRMWERARSVDLGPDADCEGGLHAAAMGGLWQAAVLGFAGARLEEGRYLTIDPRLPDRWSSLTFPLVAGDVRWRVSVTRSGATLSRHGSDRSCEYSISTDPLRLDLLEVDA